MDNYPLTETRVEENSVRLPLLIDKGSASRAQIPCTLWEGTYFRRFVLGLLEQGVNKYVAPGHKLCTNNVPKTSKKLVLIMKARIHKFVNY